MHSVRNDHFLWGSCQKLSLNPNLGSNWNLQTYQALLLTEQQLALLSFFRHNIRILLMIRRSPAYACWGSPLEVFASSIILFLFFCTTNCNKRYLLFSNEGLTPPQPGWLRIFPDVLMTYSLLSFLPLHDKPHFISEIQSKQSNVPCRR